MALAYCILAHKSVGQITRLLRAIWDPQNHYVLHLDRRAPAAEHRSAEQLVAQFPNLQILPARRILWGRFGVIGAQLEAISQCLLPAKKWSHFIPLSGQDFPLRPQKEIMQELAESEPTSFMSHFDPWTTGNWTNTAERVHRVYIESAGLEWVLQLPGVGRRVRGLVGWTNTMPFIPGIRRSAPSFFRYYGGSNHLILSRQSAVHLLSDPKACAIVKWLRRSGIPDESLFQSVVLNSPLANAVVNDDRRAIYWTPGIPSPRTLTTDDLPRLREARAAGKLFARKFDEAVDAEVIAALEKDLHL